jgi:hypothetical protein
VVIDSGEELREDVRLETGGIKEVVLEELACAIGFRIDLQRQLAVRPVRQLRQPILKGNLDESLLARFTIPDVLMPAQYYGGRRTPHPEMHATKRLLLAVLEDALRCLQNYAESHNPAHRKAFGEAETWILDRKAHGPFAFETICETLAIQPDHLRDGIRQWRTQLSNGPDSRRLQRHSVR